MVLGDPVEGDSTMRISQRNPFIRVQDMHTASLPAVSEKTLLVSLSLHKTTENEKRRRFVPHIWRVKRATTLYLCVPCRWYVAFILVQEEISGCNLGRRSEKLRNGNTLAAGAGRAGVLFTRDNGHRSRNSFCKVSIARAWRLG